MDVLTCKELAKAWSIHVNWTSQAWVPFRRKAVLLIRFFLLQGRPDLLMEILMSLIHEAMAPDQTALLSPPKVTARPSAGPTTFS